MRQLSSDRPQLDVRFLRVAGDVSAKEVITIVLFHLPQSWLNNIDLLVIIAASPLIHVLHTSPIFGEIAQWETHYLSAI